MRIDIWSDYVCPFCTIGMRHLDLALEQFEGKDDVEIVWRSFELAPDTPKESPGTMVDYLVKTKGLPLEQIESMNDALAQRAEAVGLHFNWRESVSGNTRDAHRIGHLAHARALGNAWDRIVKNAHFSNGRDISDHDNLRELGAIIGLDSSEVEQVLASNLFDDAVQADEDQARDLGIRGVPFFVFDGHLALSGAQPVEVFAEVLEQACNSA